MRTIVYSCIVGGYDDPSLFNRSIFKGLDADYILFTDHTMDIDGWMTKPIFHQESNHVRTSRWHKINSHLLFPDACDTIWIDGNQIPCGKATDIINSSPLGTYKHPKRNCVYDEASCCIDMGKDDKEIIKRQMDFYKSVMYPADNGLAETCCIYRVNSLDNADINNLWWDQLAKFSHRDQLSFDYTIWKLKAQYNPIPGCRVKSDFLKHINHIIPIF